MKKFIILLILSLIGVAAFSQRGKDLAKTISAAATVNEYTSLTADAAAGTNTISVASSTLNGNGRFGGALVPGDLVLIIQMQGATIRGTLSGNHCAETDSSWGEVTNYNNCGFYEFQEVSSVPTNSSITFDCGLQHSYTASGHAQVVRVPRFASLTINAGGNLTCDAWQGSTGGVLVVEVQGNTTIATGGKMDVSGKGYRGAALLENQTNWGVNNFATTLATGGAEKGEGVGGYQADYDLIGGRYGKGAPGNGGGGGNAQNAGGAGGGNGGAVNAWTGHGVPDLSGSYSTAWNLDYSWIVNTTSPGGGNGGYTFASNKTNPLTNGPSAAAWGGDLRARQGGFGGRPMDYSNGRIFMGGGGGSGDQNNNTGGAGGNGGGLIYVMNYGVIGGAGQIISNGNNGFSTINAFPNGGIDGAGGAGSGGTVILNAVGAIAGISVTANGGNGGNQVVAGSTTESEGPGGGGGGGYVAISNGAIVRNTVGGTNGTTNNTGMTNFPPNGATKGGTGIANAAITNFTITATNDTVCSGTTASLSVLMGGTVPTGTVVEWYTTATGGVSIGTGNPFTSPVINSNTTYYAGTCPGSYRVALNVIIQSKPVANAGSPVTICSGSSTILTASGGTTYSWSPATGLSSTNTASTTASPASTTTYTVTVGNSGGCTDMATVQVTVSSGSGPSVSASASPAIICNGKSSVLNATAPTAVSYTWTPVTGLSSSTVSNPTANPTSSITYTVTVKDGSGCSALATAAVTVNQRPTANPGPAVSECKGSGVVLNGSGGGTYSWSPAAGLSSTNVSNPTATSASPISYTLTVTDANGCRDSATVLLTVNALPSIAISGPASVCVGITAPLQASGASSYSWSPAAGLSSTTISNPVATLSSSSTTYTVTGTDANNCVNTSTITIQQNQLPKLSISFKDTSGCSPYCVSFKAMDSSGTCSSSSITFGDGTTGTGSQTGHCYTIPGNYVMKFTCTDGNGCTNSVNGSHGIRVVPHAMASFTSAGPLIEYSGATPDSICFTNTSTGANSYIWDFGNGTGSSAQQKACVAYADSGSYCISLKASNTSFTYTCRDSIIQCIHLSQLVKVSYLIPNIFSPNNDGLNDVFMIHNTGLKTLDCVIFDRWGKKIYEFNTPDGGWDGKTTGGQRLNDGTYYYIVKIQTESGVNKEEKGFVQLITGGM